MYSIDTTNTISRKKLAEIAQERFGDMVKGVVDIEQKILVLDADLHADQEALLLEKGSLQKNLWGINLYPELEDDDFIEFDSMINLRPSQGNLSRGIENPKIQEKIKEIITLLIVGWTQLSIH